MNIDLAAWRRLIEASPAWCTCTYDETRYGENPEGHIVGCPSWGTTNPHRLTVERELLEAAERLAQIAPVARAACDYAATQMQEHCSITALRTALERSQ